MNNAMKLKAVIKALARQKGISAQLVLQNYMLERLLERIALSKYRDYFVIKGGFLIASMVGLDTRATMDIDATICGYPLKLETLCAMLKDIVRIDIDDAVHFILNDIKEIREQDDYGGYRVTITAQYPPMAIPLKIDITTGDKITPRAIEYEYHLLLEDRSIRVLAYNLVTLLAEKLETVIVRGDQNTRLRDYYDIYILTKLYAQDIDITLLKKALFTTAEKRGTTRIVRDYRSQMDIVRSSTVMAKYWDSYAATFAYAQALSFIEVCEAVDGILKQVLC